MVRQPTIPEFFPFDAGTRQKCSDFFPRRAAPIRTGTRMPAYVPRSMVRRPSDESAANAVSSDVGTSKSPCDARSVIASAASDAGTGGSMSHSGSLTRMLDAQPTAAAAANATGQADLKEKINEERQRCDERSIALSFEKRNTENRRGKRVARAGYRVPGSEGRVAGCG